MFKNKFIVPSLLVVILLLLSFIAFMLYQSIGGSNSKKEILDRVDKLASIEGQLPSINQGNLYMLQMNDQYNNVPGTLDKLEKGSNTAKRIFDGLNFSSLDKKSQSYIELFNINFAKFKSDKKEYECMTKAYFEYNGLSSSYSMISNVPEDTTERVKKKIEDAQKCGLKVDQSKVEELLAEIKSFYLLSEEMNKFYSQNSKFEQILPQAPSAEQDKLGMKFGEVSGKISNSIYYVVNSKYTPLVEYSNFIKSSQDNF